jgi:hypothetical protein
VLFGSRRHGEQEKRRSSRSYPTAGAAVQGGHGEREGDGSGGAVESGVLLRLRQSGVQIRESQRRVAVATSERLRGRTRACR